MRDDGYFAVSPGVTRAALRLRTESSSLMHAILSSQLDTRSTRRSPVAVCRPLRGGPSTPPSTLVSLIFAPSSSGPVSRSASTAAARPQLHRSRGRRLRPRNRRRRSGVGKVFSDIHLPTIVDEFVARGDRVAFDL